MNFWNSRFYCKVSGLSYKGGWLFSFTIKPFKKCNFAAQ